MPEDDRPPEQIWLDDERLNAHFDSLRTARQDGLNGVSAPATDLQQNELTKGLI